VLKTSVGYTGGQTVHPIYDQVCSHATGGAPWNEERYSLDEYVTRIRRRELRTSSAK
jgi:peptide methionine sulfoxide reductase MsrA